MAKRQRTNLLRQRKGVRADHRAERPAAAAELRHPGRAVTRAAGALLLVHLLAGAPDLRAALGLVGAGLALGELPVDAALNDIDPRIETENGIRQLDRAGVLALKRGAVQFHLTVLPARRPALDRAEPPRLPGGTCPASARLSAKPS